MRDGSVEFLYNQKNRSFPGIIGGYHTCENGELKMKYCPSNIYSHSTAWNGTHCSSELYLKKDDQINFSWEMDPKHDGVKKLKHLNIKCLEILKKTFGLKLQICFF